MCAPCCCCKARGGGAGRAAALCAGPAPVGMLILAPEDHARVWWREPVQQLARPLAFALGAALLLAPQLQSALLTEFHAAPRPSRSSGPSWLSTPGVEPVCRRRAAHGAGCRRDGPARRRPGGAGHLARLVGWEERFTFLPLSATLRLPPLRRNPPSSAPRPACLCCSLGLAWFVVATFVIVPAYAQPLYGRRSTYFARYGALDSAADIFKNSLAAPTTGSAGDCVLTSASPTCWGCWRRLAGSACWPRRSCCSRSRCCWRTC